MTNFIIFKSDSTQICVNSDIRIQNIIKFCSNKNQLFLLSSNNKLFTGFIDEDENDLQLKLIKFGIIDIECWNELLFIVDENGFVYKKNLNSLSDNDNDWIEVIVPSIKYCSHGIKSITEKVRICKININNDGILFTSFNKELYGMGNFSEVLQSDNPIKVECFSGLKILQVSMGDNFAVILTSKKTDENYDDYDNDINDIFINTECIKCLPKNINNNNLQLQQQQLNQHQYNNNNYNKNLNLSKSTTETSMASSPSDLMTFDSDENLKNITTTATTTTATTKINDINISSCNNIPIKSSKDTAINFFLESLSISSEDFIEAGGKQTKLLKENVSNITSMVYEGVKTLSRHMSGSDNNDTPPPIEQIEILENNKQITTTITPSGNSSSQKNNSDYDDYGLSLSETSSFDLDNDNNIELQIEFGIESKINHLCRLGNNLITTGVWSFGSINREGQLGTGDQVKRTRIIPVLKLQNQGVIKISSYKEHSIALTLDGRMFLWGSNLLHQISSENFNEFTAPKMFKNKERIFDGITGKNFTISIFNDLTIHEECFDYNRKFLEKIKPFDISDKSLYNNDNEIKLINNNEQIFLTTNDYFLINKICFTPVFNHLTSEEKFLFEILNTYNTTVKPFLKKTYSTENGQLYDNLCHLYFNIINLTALNVHTLRNYYIMKHINCLDLIFIKNSNEMISLYRNYLKKFTNVACCKKSFNYISLLLEKSTTINIRKIFESPFHRIWSYVDLITDLLRYENDTDILLILEEKKKLWDKFRIEKDLLIDEMDRTIKFWHDAEKNLINELQEPERRLILDSKEISLKVTPSGPFVTQRFILFTDYLCYYANQLYKFPLQTLWIQSLPDTENKKNILKIVTPELNLIVIARNHEDKMKWLDEISKYVKFSLNKSLAMKVPSYRNTSYEFGNKHQKFAGVKYFGMWNSNGNMHGIGRLEFPDGKVYNGLMTSSEIQGFGQMFSPSQGTYEGNFENGKYHGYGILEMKNKERYKGNFRNGEFYGHGKLENDRYQYIGEFIKNMKHGYGILYDILSGEKYLGMFENNKKHGLGILVTIDGDYFNGIFVDDNLSGDGLSLLIDGSYFRGEITMNGPNGKGSLYIPIVKTENLLLDDYKKIFVEGRRITGTFNGTWNNIKISNGQLGMDIIKSEEIDSINIKSNKKWCSLFKDWETEVFGEQTKSYQNNCLWNKISVYISNSKRKEKFKSDGFEMKNQQIKQQQQQQQQQKLKIKNCVNNFDTISIKSNQSSISSQYSKRSTLDIHDTIILSDCIKQKLNDKLIINENHIDEHSNNIIIDEHIDDDKKHNIIIDNKLTINNYQIYNDHNVIDEHDDDIRLNGLNNKKIKKTKENILESTPNFGVTKELTIDDFLKIKEYLYEAFKDLNHPLGVLITKISKCFHFSYGHWNSKKPTILISQAIQELESISIRIYEIVRKLFPSLPEDKCFVENKTISHRSFYDILLSNSIYSSLFVLYASKCSPLDEICQRRMRYCDKKTDEELLRLLKIDIKVIPLIKHNYFREAIIFFRRVETKYCPLEMLEQIIKTINYIKKAAKETMDESYSLNADELLPLTIFLILRASIPHLGAELLLLEDLLETNQELTGEETFSFTHFQISYTYIISNRFFDELFC